MQITLLIFAHAPCTSQRAKTFPLYYMNANNTKNLFHGLFKIVLAIQHLLGYCLFLFFIFNFWQHCLPLISILNAINQRFVSNLYSSVEFFLPLFRIVDASNWPRLFICIAKARVLKILEYFLLCWLRMKW
jgi:hypothetical protein